MKTATEVKFTSYGMPIVVYEIIKTIDGLDMTIFDNRKHKQLELKRRIRTQIRETREEALKEYASCFEFESSIEDLNKAEIKNKIEEFLSCYDRISKENLREMVLFFDEHRKEIKDKVLRFLLLDDLSGFLNYFREKNELYLASKKAKDLHNYMYKRYKGEYYWYINNNREGNDLNLRDP